MAKLCWLVLVLVINIVSSATQLDSHQTDLETLAAKVAQLELLEQRFQKLESLEHRLQSLESIGNRFQQLESLLRSVPLNEEVDVGKSILLKDQQQQPTGRANKLYRTCHETRASDPSLTSGMYYIDPDGQDIGDNPIYVYCDMTTGETAISHDTESKTDVGHCADPGCYSRTITYPNVTLRQMIALADFSTECHQAIKYDCNYAPFELNGVAYSWWNDRNGTARYFWAGNNSSAHTCQCGLDRNCVDSLIKCNCDSLAPVALADDGVITDKNFLPVTRLNFGRTQLSSSSGAHTLGKFTCSGQFIFKGAPSTCVDLSLIGYTLSGFYSVKGESSQSTQLETIYCNFNKLPSDSGYETRIGFPELRSAPTYFSVKRNTSTASSTTGVITFQVEQLNIGGAMNLTSGIFTAPRNGTYYFSFSGLASSRESNTYLQIQLSTNKGRNLGSTKFSVSDYYSSYGSGSIEATARLTAGEEVSLVIIENYYAYLYEDGISNFNQFTGWLLQEDAGIY